MKLYDLLKDYQNLPEYSGRTLSSVNQKSLFNDYPMNIAATRGSIAEMELLLAEGADVNCSGEHGYSPLHDAVEQEHLDAVSWLMKNGADLDSKTNDNMTPLELARVLGYEDIVRILNNGAQ